MSSIAPLDYTYFSTIIKLMRYFNHLPWSQASANHRKLTVLFFYFIFSSKNSKSATVSLYFILLIYTVLLCITISNLFWTSNLIWVRRWSAWLTENDFINNKTKKKTESPMKLNKNGRGRIKDKHLRIILCHHSFFFGPRFSNICFSYSVSSHKKSIGKVERKTSVA